MNPIICLIILGEETLSTSTARETKPADAAIDATTASEPISVGECQNHQEDQDQKQDNLNSDIESKKSSDTSSNDIDNGIPL